MELPSNKVGIVLIVVVLLVAGTVFFDKIFVGKGKEYTDLQNVDLLIGRNTDGNLKAGDGDGDGLIDWQEELYGTDSRVSDTDGDGTNDGEEVGLKRDPRVPGPNDPLLTYMDFVQTDVDLTNFATGTITEKLSIDLLTEYLLLKKNNQLTAESSAQIVTQLANQAIAKVDLSDRFSSSDIILIDSGNEEVKRYGTDFAALYSSNLLELDELRSLAEAQYLPAVSQKYKEFGNELMGMSVPSVARDVHLEIANRIYQTGVVIEALTQNQSDPVRVVVIIGQYQAYAGDSQLYTSLTDYFRNNGIIFDDEQTIKFWKYFEK